MEHMDRCTRWGSSHLNYWGTMGEGRLWWVALKLTGLQRPLIVKYTWIHFTTLKFSVFNFTLMVVCSQSEKCTPHLICTTHRSSSMAPHSFISSVDHCHNDPNCWPRAVMWRLASWLPSKWWMWQRRKKRRSKLKSTCWKSTVTIAT